MKHFILLVVIIMVGSLAYHLKDGRRTLPSMPLAYGKSIQDKNLLLSMYGNPPSYI